MVAGAVVVVVAAGGAVVIAAVDVAAGTATPSDRTVAGECTYSPALNILAASKEP